MAEQTDLRLASKTGFISSRLKIGWCTLWTRTPSGKCVTLTVTYLKVVYAHSYTGSIPSWDYFRFNLLHRLPQHLLIPPPPPPPQKKKKKKNNNNNKISNRFAGFELAVTVSTGGNSGCPYACTKLHVVRCCLEKLKFCL